MGGGHDRVVDGLAPLDGPSGGVEDPAVVARDDLLEAGDSPLGPEEAGSERRAGQFLMAGDDFAEEGIVLGLERLRGRPSRG